jgi:hypothetical protein
MSRVRDEARRQLGWLVHHVLFGARPIAALNESEQNALLYRLHEHLGTGPLPTPAMTDHTTKALRAQLLEAVDTLRPVFEAIARGAARPWPVTTLRTYLDWRRTEDNPAGQWWLQTGLRDALALHVMVLLRHVDRALIRACDYQDCGRVFIGWKGQKRCVAHLADARREAQRRAQAAFQARRRVLKQQAAGARGRTLRPRKRGPKR